MSSEAEYELPDRFDAQANTALVHFLKQNIKNPVAISARNLRKLDVALLQFLLCTSQTWAKAGLGLRLTNVSSDAKERLTILGIGQDLLVTEGA